MTYDFEIAAYTVNNTQDRPKSEKDATSLYQDFQEQFAAQKDGDIALWRGRH